MPKTNEFILGPEDIVNLLTPFLDPRKNQCALSKFTSETDEMLKIIEDTGRPLVLTRHGKIIAVVQNPHLFSEMEKRRRSLAALLDGTPILPPDAEIPRPTATRIKAIDSVLRKEEAVKSRLSDNKRQIRKIQYTLDLIKSQEAKAEEELRAVQLEKQRLLSTLNAQ